MMTIPKPWLELPSADMLKRYLHIEPSNILGSSGINDCQQLMHDFGASAKDITRLQASWYYEMV